MNETSALPDILIGAFGPIRRRDAGLYHGGTVGSCSGDFQVVGILRHHNHRIYSKLPRREGHGLSMVPAGMRNHAISPGLRTKCLERCCGATDLE